MEADISTQAVGLASSADFSLINLFIRADIHKRFNNLEEAIIDYQQILKNEKNNTKAKKELIKTRRIKKP